MEFWEAFYSYYRVWLWFWCLTVTVFQSTRLSLPTSGQVDKKRWVRLLWHWKEVQDIQAWGPRRTPPLITIETKPFPVLWSPSWAYVGAALFSPESLVMWSWNIFMPSSCKYGIIRLHSQTKLGREGRVHAAWFFWSQCKNTLHMILITC